MAQNVGECSQHPDRAMREHSRDGTRLQLIDVRSRAEWLTGHLPNAISMPLLDIESHKSVINPDTLAEMNIA